MVVLSIACLASFLVTVVSLAFCVLGVGVLVAPAALWLLRRTAQLGRTPTDAELAATLGVAVSELHSAADDVQRAVVLSLQGFAAGTAEDLVPDRTQGPEELLLHREKIGYLHQAIAALPERLRTVVESYFLDERPMAVIASELGVTESRVSQLRAEALTLLRDGINSQLDPDQLPTHVRQDGCIARRRHTYYSDVAARGNLHSRLTHTTPLGTPLRAAG